MLVTLALGACGDNLTGPRILFVHGGAGTGGFVDVGGDEELSDVTDTSIEPFNHGYGQLAALLRDDGFVVDQATEGPANDNTPVDLDAVGLLDHAVVVFGSNNATYDGDAAVLVERFVRGGGGALFISDANWGLFWDKAPSSDQTFLTQFGLVMNQDGGGRIALSGADFLDPEHPILRDVEAFDGEGVSPCSLSHDPAALATPTRLVIARDIIHRNTAPDGPLTAPTDDDASLAVVEYGAGRVACHFDRNTFFNENGGGTAITSRSNRIYARNLFAWLAGRI